VNPADRFRLLGTYSTPRVRVGRVLTCEARDCDVIVTGFSGGPIRWPVGRPDGPGIAALVVYGGLATAVRRETAQAVARAWGVSRQTVSQWRRALGVGDPSARRSEAARTRVKQFLPKGRGWTPAEDELVRALPAPEAAGECGRSLTAVYQRRAILGLPDGRPGSRTRYLARQRASPRGSVAR
jgi:transposase-like protein